MRTVTITLKTGDDSQRETEIYPTASTIERFRRHGWDVSAAEKALKDATKGKSTPKVKEEE